MFKKRRPDEKVFEKNLQMSWEKIDEILGHSSEEYRLQKMTEILNFLIKGETESQLILNVPGSLVSIC